MPNLALDRVLLVTHTTSQHLMRRAEQNLQAAGCQTKMVTAAGFNASQQGDSETEVLLVTNAADCSANSLARFTALRGVVFLGSGTDTIDLAYAATRGLQVGHSPTPENAESMSEATVLLILASIYRLNDLQRLIPERLPRPAQPYGRMLKKKIIGLIGFGRIARGVVERLCGWDVKFLAYSPTINTKSLPAQVRATTIEEVLEKSDIVSLHAAMHDGLRNLLDRERIGRMKQGAILINTARGSLVDETALHEAVASGRLAAVALDTFSQEPPSPDNPLFKLRQGIFTPHIIGHTAEALDSVVNAAVDNSLAILKGERAKFLKNPEVSASFR